MFSLIAILEILTSRMRKNHLSSMRGDARHDPSTCEECMECDLIDDILDKAEK